MLINATVAPAGGPLTITAVFAEAEAFDTGKITFAVNKPCIVRVRFMSGGGQPTTKGDTPTGDFPPNFELNCSQAGTYAFFDGANAGGTLSESTGYTVGIYGWIEGFIEGEVGNEETAIINLGNPAFTTPAQGTLTAPTSITPTGFSLSETASIEAAWGGLSNNGVPDTGTWSITSDVDAVANIDAATGVLTLESALDYATSTSHSVTVNFANTEGNTSQVLTLTVLEAGAASSIPVADSTKSSLAAIATEITTNWTGPDGSGEYTAPGAPAAYTFALSANDAASNWTDYKFTHPVTIRGTGTPTAGWNDTNKKPTRGGVTELTGALTIGDSKNLRLILMSLNTVTVSGSNLCTLERCSIWGNEFDGTDSGFVSGSNSISLDSTTDFTVKDCNVSFGNRNLLQVDSGSTRLTIDGYCGDHIKADSLRFGGSQDHTDVVIRNAWHPRTMVTAAGAHNDSLQMRVGLVSGLTAEYVACIPGYSYNGNKTGLQGPFISGGAVAQNAYVSQYIQSSNYANAMYLDSTPIGVASVRQSDILQPADHGGSILQIVGPWTDYDYNVTGGKGKQGANDATVPYTANTLDPTTASGTGLYTGDPIGLASVGFEALLPPSSAVRTHWGFVGGSGKVGAWDLKKRVFVDGLHPGNIGWPMAEVWERQFNPNGTITTTYTGTYDADGSNV